MRWTGRLAAQLGDANQIIEEGLNGRTTIFDYADRVGKNGRDALRPAPEAHARIAELFAAKLTGAGAATPSSGPPARSVSGTSA